MTQHAKIAGVDVHGIREFLTPSGSPRLCESLAIGRSLGRWQLLKEWHSAHPEDETACMIVSNLAEIQATDRFQILAMPELALLIQARLSGGNKPAADLAVAATVAAISPGQGPRSLRLRGRLQRARQPVGPWIIEIRAHGLRDLIFTWDCDAGWLAGETDEGARLTYTWPRTARVSDVAGPAERRPEGNRPWELVDGWNCFTNPFDDGNLSVIPTGPERAILQSEMERAWDLVCNVCPLIAQEMVHTARYVSPLQPTKGGSGIPSFSSRDYPGVLFIGTHDRDGRLLHWHQLAELCVHEHLHNRLYLLEEVAPLTAPQTSPQLYFSPWKKCLRPIDGMIHAIYVFAHLAWFWDRVAAVAQDSSLTQLANVRTRDYRDSLTEALAAVCDTDELSPAGIEILRACERVIGLLTPSTSGVTNAP